MNKCCENCIFGVDYGESTLYIKCERGRKTYVEKGHSCKYFAERSENIERD